MKGARPHGGVAAYRHGCRCDTCRAGNAERNRRYRKRMQEKFKNGSVEIQHGAGGYTNWGCRCDVCKQVHLSRNKGAAEAWRARHPEKDKKQRSRAWLKAFNKAQAESLTKATRHRAQWTGHEMELAARSDLSSRQVALVLGRTVAAVRTMRQRLRRDPATIGVAGIARGTSSPT